MIQIAITPSLDHKVRKIDPLLREEVFDVIDKLKDQKNHKSLKVHKLHGKAKGLYAASVDYQHRLIFQWVQQNRILLLDFGNHSVYEWGLFSVRISVLYFLLATTSSATFLGTTA
ncbi:hypothetical protein HY413_03020 [Candidatus Kaiserbacteria bacterium]|nr:hypothetical protein [Candidatus Kaiserbacteria bacterium]